MIHFEKKNYRSIDLADFALEGQLKDNSVVGISLAWYNIPWPLIQILIIYICAANAVCYFGDPNKSHSDGLG